MRILRSTIKEEYKVKKHCAVFIALTLVMTLLISSCAYNVDVDNDAESELSQQNDSSLVSKTESNVKHIHNFGDWKTVREPTCDENGYAESSCSCGEKLSKTIYSSGHTYGEWIVITDANCNTAGSKQRECGKCGTRDLQTIPATHDYVIESTKEETCEAEGVKKYVCKRCGEEYNENIAATGHNWKTATCTEAKTCTRCGKTEGKALGHQFSGWTCTRCGKEKDSNIDISQRLEKILLFSGVYGYMMLMIKFEKIDCTNVAKYKFHINLYDSNGSFYNTATYTIDNDDDQYLTRLLCFGKGNWNKFTAKICQIDFIFNDGTTETARVDYSKKLYSSISLEDIDYNAVVWFD